MERSIKIQPCCGVAVADNRLVADSLHLWRLSLDINADEYERLASVLDEQEWQRANKFKIVQARSRFVAGRGLLRLMLAWYLSVAPTTIKIEQGEHGKPRLVGSTPDHGLVFNVSHSRDLALFAFAHDQKFGVDLEYRRNIKNIRGMVRRCFSDRERSEWDSSDLSQRQRLFFSFWTAKEAMIKADGRGLALGVQRCELQHTPALGYIELPENCGAPSEWALHGVDCGAGFSGALAIRDPSCSIVYRTLPRKWLFDLYFPAGVG